LQDGVILAVIYEGRYVDLVQNPEMINKNVDRLTEGLSEKQKKEIQNLGIDLYDHIDFGGRSVNLNAYNLEVNFLKENDWFDVKGYVRVGLQDIPFLDLLNNIRENNPYFLLDDGTYFIIPQEWLTKYSSLAKFGKEEGNRFKVAKTHYGILEELGETEQSETLTTIEIDETLIDYKPTKALKAKLRPYQLDGVKWLLKHQNNGLGACLADDMGLGKTLQVIAALLYTKEQMPNTEAFANGQTQDAQLSMFASNYEEDILKIEIQKYSKDFQNSVQRIKFPFLVHL